MLWIKAFHIIFMVAWFSGLFYLPRIFVYHSDSIDDISCQRFVVMEKKLYYYIMWPAGLLTTFLGGLLLFLSWPAYVHAIWMHIKLLLVVFVWCFHLSCGFFYKRFASNQQVRPSTFFRFFNEIPTVLLMAIVFLVVLQP